MAPDPDRSEFVSRRKFIVGVGATGVATIAGCTEGDDDGGSSPTNGNGNDNEDNNGTVDLSGSIRISGSSTVFPVAEAVGELFTEEYPDAQSPELSRDGSSGGFENFFIPGDSDINNSSRRITEQEVQNCRDTGFEPVEFEVAKDALTVIVNNDNDWVDSLTYSQLESIWNPENPPETWAEVEGAEDDWPDEPLDLYGPASTSGTFDYFTSTILGEAGRIRDDFEGTEEDDQIASGVQGNQYAFGYLPFAYYTNNPEETTAVPLAQEEGDDPTDPSLDAASTGEYPLARPLFFYANDNRVQDKEVLQLFIEFYIEQTKDKSLMADQIGYVQSSEENAQTNQDRLDQAIDDEYEHPF